MPGNLFRFESIFVCGDPVAIGVREVVKIGN